MKKVLVLCTGNSARSIIAECLINHYLGDTWQAYSAGVEPSTPNRYALKVLDVIGVSHAGARSKSVAEFLDRDDLDLVITVCDHARETCPVFLRPIEQVHIGIEDPAPFSDESEEIALSVFRQTTQTIKEKVIGFLVNKMDHKST